MNASSPRNRARGTVILHLTPLPDDVPAAVRLRRALKTLLRRDGFRCVKVEGDGLDERPGEIRAEVDSDHQ